MTNEMKYYYTTYWTAGAAGYIETQKLDEIHEQIHVKADKAVTREVDTSIKLQYGNWETTIARTDKANPDKNKPFKNQ